MFVILSREKTTYLPLLLNLDSESNNVTSEFAKPSIYVPNEIAVGACYNLSNGI